MEQIIKILKYSEYPGPRYIILGEHSGEDFYYEVLNRAFARAVSQNDTLVVDLDGTAGYASSFLDEAFGNLVYDFGLGTVQKHLKLISNIEPDWIRLLNEQTFQQWESRRQKQKPPKYANSHSDRYVIEKDQLIKK